MKNQNSKIKIQNFGVRLRRTILNLNKTKMGFTLLETLIAVSVLILAIAGALSLVSQGIKTASYFKNQTTAYYLASEAMEYIKNRRDSNKIQGDNWDDFKSVVNVCLNPTGCRIDATLPDSNSNSIRNCPSGGCPVLKYDSDKSNATYGFYGYDNDWADTIFKRKVNLSNIDPLREIEVKVDVSWTDRFGNHNILLRENIFDW